MPVPMEDATPAADATEEASPMECTEATPMDAGAAEGTEAATDAPMEVTPPDPLADLKAEIARRVREVNALLLVKAAELGVTTEEDNSKKKKRERKKKRWGNANEVNGVPLVPMGMGMGVPGMFVAQRTEQDFWDAERVKKLTKCLMINDFTDIHKGREPSPSPPPTYGREGKRTNTRDVRYKAKYQKERDDLVKGLLSRDPTYKPPVHYTSKKLQYEKRIYLDPANPGLKGAIIGVRGMQHRKMQEETNCKIRIQGRNSGQHGMKDFGREEVDDDLHCLVVADNELDLAKGVAAVEHVIDESLKGDTKEFREQMLLLDKINGTFRPDKMDRYKEPAMLTMGTLGSACTPGAGGGGGGAGGGGAGGAGGAGASNALGAHGFRMPQVNIPSMEQMALANAVPWAVATTDRQLSAAYLKEQVEMQAFQEQLFSDRQKENKLNDEYRSFMSSLNGEDPSKVKEKPTLEQEIDNLGFIICSNCEQPGHVARDCMAPKGAAILARKAAAEAQAKALAGESVAPAGVPAAQAAAPAPPAALPMRPPMMFGGRPPVALNPGMGRGMPPMGMMPGMPPHMMMGGRPPPHMMMGRPPPMGGFYGRPPFPGQFGGGRPGPPPWMRPGMPQAPAPPPPPQ